MMHQRPIVNFLNRFRQYGQEDQSEHHMSSLGWLGRYPGSQLVNSVGVGGVHPLEGHGTINNLSPSRIFWGGQNW